MRYFQHLDCQTPETDLDGQVGWVRGEAHDYDAWACLVGDMTLSYNRLLPGFKKTEHYHTTDVDVVASWESVDLTLNRDVNGGSPRGICGGIDQVHDGVRHPEKGGVRIIYDIRGRECRRSLIAADESHVSTTIMTMLPTSCGSVKLASTNPALPPLYDPNYYATQADRYVTRTTQRRMMQLMVEATEQLAMVKGEEPVSPRRKPLSHGPRTRKTTSSSANTRGKSDFVHSSNILPADVHFSGILHPAGTAAMGRVVDADLRV